MKLKIENLTSVQNDTVQCNCNRSTPFQVDNDSIVTDDVFVGYDARESEDLNLKYVLILNRGEVEL